MAVFEHTFSVRAPLEAVALFHRDTRALKRLTPPPILVQLHHIEPLAEGSLARFTLWFGPLPVRWTAVHTEVDPLRGFTDTLQGGLLRRWRHTHRFTAEGSGRTRVHERIEFEYHPGLRGLLGRLLFAPPGLRLLFWYRGLATRRALEGA